MVMVSTKPGERNVSSASSGSDARRSWAIKAQSAIAAMTSSASVCNDSQCHSSACTNTMSSARSPTDARAQPMTSSRGRDGST